MARVTSRRPSPAAITLITALAMSLALLASPARAADNRGREFWLAFPPNFSGDNTLTVAITAASPATGSVTVPGLGFSQAFAAVPGQTVTVTVPDGAELATSNEVRDAGVRVSASPDVSVVAFSHNTNGTTSEGFMALPTVALGREYVNLSYPSSGGGTTTSGSQFAVVGTQPGTAVSITPSVTTDGHPAGVPYIVTLGAGDAYLLRNADVGADLSGTVISANRPVAVIAGQRCGNIPVNFSACDHTAEQLPPVPSWGWRFVTAPMAERPGGDTMRLVASENGTTVRFNGAAVATLDRGGVYERVVTGAAEWSADRPVLLMQYANGSTFDGPGATMGDPHQMLVPPLNGFAGSPSFWVPPSGFALNYVNVVVASRHAGAVSLDGTTVGGFAAIGQSGYSFARVPVAPGAHRVVAPSAVAANVYGFGPFVSYGYPAGLDVTPVALSLSVDSASPVVNTDNCVTAAVAPGVPGAARGAAVSFRVSGANDASDVAVADGEGRARLCYRGGRVGTDVIRASAGSATASATATWVRVVRGITLDPASAASVIGEQHCVTATVLDQAQQPFAGVDVTFSIRGANSATGAAVSGSDGAAAFCYSGARPGADTIDAAAAGVSATVFVAWRERERERDGDGDGIPDARDNCPDIANAGQEDRDADDIGDACEILPPGDVPVVAGETAVVRVERGEVFVRLPARARLSRGMRRAQARAAQEAPIPGFVPIKGVASVPIGSVVDARRGTLALTTAGDYRKGSTRRRLQSGSFTAALFAIRQARSRKVARASRPPTELVLQTPPGHARACAARSPVRPIKGVVRTFSGAAVKGIFRTVGGASVTTVTRRSNWIVQDTCNGTRTEVGRGRATVRDRAARRTVTVRAGQGYYARARLFGARRARG